MRRIIAGLILIIGGSIWIYMVSKNWTADTETNILIIPSMIVCVGVALTLWGWKTKE